MAEAKKTPLTQNISKITPRDVGANAAGVLSMTDANARYPLMRVWGVARGTKVVKSKDRLTGTETAHVALVGDFRAVNLNDNTRYGSGILYLPAGIHELIQGPIDKAKADGDTAEVEFGMDLYGRKTNSPAGYGYVAVNLGEDPSVVDNMSKLEERINKIAPLPAPARQEALAAPEA